MNVRGRVHNDSRDFMNGYPANPKHHATRRAVTLAEVLIAMGILMIGLLGVAAIFPVGGHYMQTGDIADRGGAIAQAALDDAIVRGYLDPESWVVHDINDVSIDLSDSPATLDNSIQNGAFMQLSDGDTGTNNSRLGLRQASVGQTGEMMNSSMMGSTLRSAAFGDAFVIDPIGLAGALDDDQLGSYTNIVGDPESSFPTRHFPGFIGPFEFANSQWNPWHSVGAYWPVRRVTPVHSAGVLNSPSFKLQEPLAREFFSAADDLAQHFPVSGDDPVRQRWQNWTPGTGDYFASSRQSQGDYSWIISVAPSSSTARDALVTRPDAYPVEVSVVVFHKRTAARGLQATAEAERLVTARVATAGPSGGELLLTRRPSVAEGGVDPEPSPFEDLRAGQYVMVVGPHPLSTNTRPQLAVRWCRVLNIEDTGQPTLPGGQPTLDRDKQILVALRGPDWPWQQANNLELGGNPGEPPLGTRLSNDLRVAILPGAVAVHTKTMRLESGSEWSID
ncbi:hypothetical protein MalM25_37580 [Planctomycetes bacterium MalM25]|nr:hypothetical protein MalM25_37580 [Planctomycetes bacterium MalM25]